MPYELSFTHRNETLMIFRNEKPNEKTTILNENHFAVSFSRH